MSERNYTATEIMELRHVVERHYLYGTYRLTDGGHVSRNYHEDEMARVVEERVRTFILAGITAKDLASPDTAMLG